MAFDPNTFADDTTPDPTMSEVQETVREDGTRERNADLPIPVDIPEDVEDPVADQMAAELIRMGFKDADNPDLPEATPVEAPVGVPASTPAVEPDVVEPAAGEAVSPAPASPEAPHVIDFGEHGTVQLTDAELRDVVIRDAYYAAKPPETWAVLGDIESGARVPITKQEYEEYRALKSRPAAAPTPPPAPVRISDDELQYLDPATQARIRQLETQVSTALPIQPSPGPFVPAEPAPDAPSSPYPSPAQVLQEQARLNAIDGHVTAALTELKAKHSLSDEDLAEINNYAVQSQLVVRHSPAHSTHLPDGSIISTDYPSLFAHVLDDAYATHPKFRQRLIDEEVQKRLDSEQAAIRKTNDKRALAGSIASTPSAALTSPSSPPVNDRAALTAAIAEEIRRSQSG